MKIYLDSANLESIEQGLENFDLQGVTCNPSILAKEGQGFLGHLQAVRRLIGPLELHVQVLYQDYTEMLREAEFIVKKFGAETYVKVPVNLLGLRVLKNLKREGYNVTATAVYTLEQAMLAGSVGADYVAPYYNRIEKMGEDASSLLNKMATLYNKQGIPTKILAASFQSKEQVLNALLAGADGVTLAPELLVGMLGNEEVEKAIDKFNQDWKNCFGDSNFYEIL